MNGKHFSSEGDPPSKEERQTKAAIERYNKGGMVIAPKGGYCGDMELEYAKKGTTDQLQAALERLAVAEGLLRKAQLQCNHRTNKSLDLANNIHTFLTAAPGSGEWVVVEKGKLELVLDDWLQGNVAPGNEVFNAYEELRSVLDPQRRS